MSRKAVGRQRPEPEAPKKQRTTAIIAIVVLVFALAGIAAMTTGRPAGDTPTAAAETISETQPVTITGTPLPRYPDQGPDPAIGMTAPELVGASFDGTPVTITNDGVPKVIMFIAHWCPHCNNDVEALRPYIKQNGIPDGTAIYAVSTSPQVGAPNYPPSQWLTDWPVTTLADDPENSAAQAYGLNAFPFFVFVTADGVIDFRFPGEVPPDALMDALNLLAKT